MRKQHKLKTTYSSVLRYSLTVKGFSSTTVGIDDSGLHKSHFEVMQDCRLMQVAESGEVVLPHQDVRVAKRRELWF